MVFPPVQHFTLVHFTSSSSSSAPAGFDRVVQEEAGPRHVLLSWDPPAAPNGVLVNYTVLVGGATVAATPPSQESFNVTGLLPFTGYALSVQACTSAGCVSSSTLQTQTLEDGTLL